MTITSSRTDAEHATGAAALWRRLAKPLHHAAVHDFRTAAENADPPRLRSLLDKSVGVVVVSGADDEEPEIRMFRGIPQAVPPLIHGLAPSPEVAVDECAVNGQAGLVVRRGGDPVAAITIDFTRGLVSMVWIRLHPELLRHGTHV